MPASAAAPHDKKASITAAMHGRHRLQRPGTVSSLPKAVVGWPWHHVKGASFCHAVAAATSRSNKGSRHGNSGTTGCSSSSSGGQGKKKTMDCRSNADGTFQPRLLTLRLQQADCVQQLEGLWEAHNQQFNSIHFSTLMHQLALLHDKPTANIMAQQQQQQQQDLSCPPDAQGLWEPVRHLQQQQPAQQGLFDSISSSSAASSVDGQDVDIENLQRMSQPRIMSPQIHRQQQQQQLSLHVLPKLQQQQPQAPPQGQMKHRAADAQQADRLMNLACAAAAVALQPAVVEQLDDRALVMIVLNLAKLGVHKPQLVTQLLQAIQPRLQQLDAQQISNLIWAVAAHATAHPQAAVAGSSRLLLVSQDWMQQACGALLRRLADADSCGATMALWGLAQLGFRPPDAWWSSLFQVTLPQLAAFRASELPVLIYCCGKLKPQVPEEWLSRYLSVSCDHLQEMSSQQLTMSLWGLAAARLSPHKAWLMAWFLTSRATMSTASTQDLSLWLYSLALLKLTPSPLWCHSYVEAAFDKLTAPGTKSQELVNVMWAVSRMKWSPPLLFWQGLMRAACDGFSTFNPQDLANCISAAVAVDVHSINREWLQAFIRASGPKLSSFQPVQLADTGAALVSVTNVHSWGHTVVPVTWLSAYVQGAAGLLGQSKFSARNLGMVVATIKQLNYLPTAVETQAFLQRAETALQHSTLQQQQQQQQQRQQQEWHPQEAR